MKKAPGSQIMTLPNHFFQPDWSYAQNIFHPSFAGQGDLNKDHMVWLRNVRFNYDFGKAIISKMGIYKL